VSRELAGHLPERLLLRRRIEPEHLLSLLPPPQGRTALPAGAGRPRRR
jgi:hypothetical protein